MVYENPPYRLETLEDVTAYVKRNGLKQGQALLRFAKTHRIEKPPILLGLPERIELEVYDLTPKVRWIIKDSNIPFEPYTTAAILEEGRQDFLNAVNGVPESIFDIIPQLTCQGTALLGKKSNKGDKTIKPNNQGAFVRIASALQEKDDFYGLLIKLLKFYLSTKNRAVKTFVKRAILIMLAYNFKTHLLDHGLIEQIRSSFSVKANFLNALHTIYGKRLERIMQNLFAPLARQFVRLSQGKILKMGLPANLKQNIIAILDQVGSAYTLERAKHQSNRLMEITEKRCLVEELKKVKSVTENFFAKLEEFESFFKQIFPIKKISSIFEGDFRLTRVSEGSEEPLATGVTLTLYPCKDYHDFLKGLYSGDCSSKQRLAARHLCHKRFFNLRVFHGTHWVGNIYLLDYTERGALIVDRIQIKNSTSLMPLNFFSRFMASLTNVLQKRAPLKVLGPVRISNFSAIQNSYASFCKQKRQEPFIFHKQDSSFECSQHKQLFVLNE